MSSSNPGCTLPQICVRKLKLQICLHCIRLEHVLSVKEPCSTESRLRSAPILKVLSLNRIRRILKLYIGQAKTSLKENISKNFFLPNKVIQKLTPSQYQTSCPGLKGNATITCLNHTPFRVIISVIAEALEKQESFIERLLSRLLIAFFAIAVYIHVGSICCTSARKLICESSALIWHIVAFVISNTDFFVLRIRFCSMNKILTTYQY